MNTDFNKSSRSQFEENGLRLAAIYFLLSCNEADFIKCMDVIEAMQKRTEEPGRFRLSLKDGRMIDMNNAADFGLEHFLPAHMLATPDHPYLVN